MSSSSYELRKKRDAEKSAEAERIAEQHKRLKAEFYERRAKAESASA